MNIVGTLLSIGQGEQPVNWVSHLLQVQDRTQVQARLTRPVVRIDVAPTVRP